MHGQSVLLDIVCVLIKELRTLVERLVLVLALCYILFVKKRLRNTVFQQFFVAVLVVRLNIFRKILLFRKQQRVQFIFRKIYDVLKRKLILHC